MALTSDELDQIEKTFRSSAALALMQPNRTSREQYARIAQLGKMLIDNNRGEHADERGQTPLGLLAKMSDKSSLAEQIVRQFDERPAGLPR